jgi:hypothetical protein
MRLLLAAESVAGQSQERQVAGHRRAALRRPGEPIGTFQDGQRPRVIPRAITRRAQGAQVGPVIGHDPAGRLGLAQRPGVGRHVGIREPDHPPTVLIEPLRVFRDAPGQLEGHPPLDLAEGCVVALGPNHLVAEHGLPVERLHAVLRLEGEVVADERPHDREGPPAHVLARCRMLMRWRYNFIARWPLVGQ